MKMEVEIAQNQDIDIQDAELKTDVVDIKEDAELKVKEDAASKDGGTKLTVKDDTESKDKDAELTVKEDAASKDGGIELTVQDETELKDNVVSSTDVKAEDKDAGMKNGNDVDDKELEKDEDCDSKPEVVDAKDKEDVNKDDQDKEDEKHHSEDNEGDHEEDEEHSEDEDGDLDGKNDDEDVDDESTDEKDEGDEDVNDQSADEKAGDENPAAADMWDTWETELAGESKNSDVSSPKKVRHSSKSDARQKRDVERNLRAKNILEKSAAKVADRRRREKVGRLGRHRSERPNKRSSKDVVEVDTSNLSKTEMLKMIEKINKDNQAILMSLKKKDLEGESTSKSIDYKRIERKRLERKRSVELPPRERKRPLPPPSRPLPPPSSSRHAPPVRKRDRAADFAEKRAKDAPRIKPSHERVQKRRSSSQLRDGVEGSAQSHSANRPSQVHKPSRDAVVSHASERRSRPAHIGRRTDGKGSSKRARSRSPRREHRHDKQKEAEVDLTTGWMDL